MKNILYKKYIQILILVIVISFGYLGFLNYKNTDDKFVRSISYPTIIKEGNNTELNDSENKTLEFETQNKGNTEETKINPIPGMGKTEDQDIKSEQITLIAGDINIKLDITEGQTFYEILQAEQQAGKITFNGKNYTGLGFFVTDIGNLHEGEGLNLLYYINGKEASLGVSRYVPKNGDIVEWKLE